MKTGKQSKDLSLPPVVHLEESNGLQRLVVLTDLCEAILYTHGATLTHWQPTGARPVLWLSGRSEFKSDRPIRGGVPICFPWFGPHPCEPKSPMHGFVRTMRWTVASVRQEPDGQVEITLTLSPSSEILRLWSCHFRLTYTVTLGSQLRLALTCENTGEDLDVYSEALHTYFAVGDASQVRVYGLENTEYIDKALGGQRNRQGGEPVVVRGETDRVYVNTRAACILNDPVWGRTITLSKSGSETTVVWNPHEEKARRLPDFGADAWEGMLCIETANAVDAAVSLCPGASHTMEARVSLT